MLACSPDRRSRITTYYTKESGARTDIISLTQMDFSQMEMLTKLYSLPSEESQIFVRSILNHISIRCPKEGNQDVDENNASKEVPTVVYD